jgi:hypothetical protein
MEPGGAFSDLTRTLEALFAKGVGATLEENSFNELALRVFAFQFEANPVYRGFCTRKGRSPDSVTAWEDVPTVPTTAFKYVDLACVHPSAAEATYVTSGTTSGSERRGRHHVPSVALYRASAVPNLRAHLVPEDHSLTVLSLIPSPRDAPHSSLSAMMGFVAEAWGEPTVWLGRADGTIDLDVLRSSAREAAGLGSPVLLAGTAFAFVHLLDELARAGESLALPGGSRIMETGGFKGRSRTVRREELYGALEARTAVPRGRIVNEYGMTELLSQLYEPVLREGPGASGRHVPPPWLKVRALDPATLAPVPAGSPGLLAFFDLANAGSVSHVLTQDVGTVTPDGVRIHGRAEGAEPRGCSLALEDILGAKEGLG